jgi:hypothetical protein
MTEMYPRIILSPERTSGATEFPDVAPQYRLEILKIRIDAGV